MTDTDDPFNQVNRRLDTLATMVNHLREERTTLLDIDDIFWEVLRDLKEWGAISRWAVDPAADVLILFVTSTLTEVTIQARNIETFVSALADGWLAGRTTTTPLHPDEKAQYDRMRETSAAYNEAHGITPDQQPGTEHDPIALLDAVTATGFETSGVTHAVGVFETSETGPVVGGVFEVGE